MKFLENLKNNIDFFLRQKFAFSRKNYFEKNESKEGLFASQKALKREEFLVERYGLNYLKSNSTGQNYLENLYTLDLLDKYFNIEQKDSTKILDIGCKNWFYAKGEYFFFKKHCEHFKLDGIELDSNRLYSNFYSRKEAAKFHIKDLSDVNYIEKDFLKLKNLYDYMVWILPFVVEEPLLKWGLPKKYFKPEKMLMQAYNLLNSSGKIFILNQGEAEYEVQKKLCEILNISYYPIGEVKSDFLDYNIQRYLILIEK